MSDWQPHHGGFIKGNIAVFPFHFGSWEVWYRPSPYSDWTEVKPSIIVPAGKNRAETIERAKRAAEEWSAYENR